MGRCRLCDISKQHGIQAKTKEVEINYKMFANPVFINPGKYMIPEKAKEWWKIKDLVRFLTVYTYCPNILSYSRHYSHYKTWRIKK